MLTWQLCDFQGIRTSIARTPYTFVIFQGGPDPLPPSGSAHHSAMNILLIMLIMYMKYAIFVKCLLYFFSNILVIEYHVWKPELVTWDPQHCYIGEFLRVPAHEFINPFLKKMLTSLSGLQIRVCIGKLFSLFLIQNIRCGYSKEPSR